MSAFRNCLSFCLYWYQYMCTQFTTYMSMAYCTLQHGPVTGAESEQRQTKLRLKNAA